MDETRQRMKQVTVGIVDVINDRVPQKVWEVLATWVVRDRIVMVTRYWGNSSSTSAAVAELGRCTGAISWTLLY